MTTKDVATVDINDDAFLRSLGSIAEVFAVFENAGIGVVDAETELGDGFVLIKDKARLVGVELVIVKHKQVTGDSSKFEGGFSVAHVVARDLGKFIIVDGSTGIHAQLTQYASSGFAGRPIHLKSGLVRSDYETEVDGKMTPATTYYLSY